MAVNTQGKLEITDLDFDTIKSNLKIFLKGQTEFTDYDFEGSGLSVLLDVLAYNTHYKAFMANMLANEMFLDTAVKRNSITSTPQDGVYTFSSIPLYEGTWITDTFTVDSTNADQKFIIDNDNVDISTVLISVQTSSTDTTTTTYVKSSSLVDILSTTAAFFTQETTNNTWEIYFGDGIVGKALVDGNIISISYIVTNKTVANGATTFLSSSPISTFTNITVTTVSNAAGGAEPEGLASIKYNAPFSYAAQNRAVNTSDYKVIVPTLYSDVESIAVWGGEYASPPVYGKVYISIRPNTGANLTTTTKDQIKTLLKNYSVASVTPEFIDPITMKIIPIVNFKYNSSVTVKTVTDLETLVRTAITTFSDDELEKFEGIFRYSKFTGIIDDTDTSILSNITTIKMSYDQTPTLSTATKYTIEFNNALYNPHSGHESIITSTGFVISSNTNTLYLNDDGIGNIRTYYLVGSTKTYVDTEAGTVDYDSGQVVLSSLNITSVSNTSGTVTITVVPESNDVVPVRNQIFEIDLTNMTVTGAEDTIASGSSNAGSVYTTTSSYN